MDKINFQNKKLPALNATNLNQLQTNVENAINSLQNNIIHATIAQNQASSSIFKLSSSNAENLTLIDAIVVGNKLSLENGKIVIGSGVNHIKVSANVYYFANVTTGRKGLYCTKNTSTAIQSSQKIEEPYCSFGFAEGYISVQEGDTIGLSSRGTANDEIYCGESSTWITVEVID